MPDLDEDDDVLDGVLTDLPPFGSLDEDEAVGVDDGMDDDEQLTTRGPEKVGLDDTEAGMDFDPVELLEIHDSESESWTVDNDAAGDAVLGAGEEMGDEGGDGGEYGWTDGNEPASVDDWADDLDLLEGNENSVAEDRGEVGVDDVVRLGGDGDDDDVDLPPLVDLADDDTGMEELADDLDLAGDGLIDGEELSFEEEARLSGALLPPPVDADRVAVEHLGPEGKMIYGASETADGYVVVGEELYRLAIHGDAAAKLEATGARDLAEAQPTSIALGDDEGRLVAIGTRLAGVLVSEDFGRRFEKRNGWHHGGGDPQVGFFVTAETHESGVRLWGRTRSGALFRSEDFGRTWSRPLLLSPVASVADDPEGGLVALSMPVRGPAQTARTDDGGHGWTMRSVPDLRRSSDTEAEYHIAAKGPNLVVTCDGHPGAVRLSRDDGESWTEASSLPAPGAVTLVREATGLALYAALFFEGADRGVVIRRCEGPEGETEEAVILDVRAERQRRDIAGAGDPEGDNRVFAIDARAEAGYTILMVATGAGLFRVRLGHR